MVTINNQKIKLKNGSDAEIVVFYSTDQSPRDDLDQAVKAYAKARPYYEYVDRKVANPRIRVVIVGVENLREIEMHELSSVISN